MESDESQGQERGHRNGTESRQDGSFCDVDGPVPPQELGKRAQISRSSTARSLHPQAPWPPPARTEGSHLRTGTVTRSFPHAQQRMHLQRMISGHVDDGLRAALLLNLEEEGFWNSCGCRRHVALESESLQGLHPARGRVLSMLTQRGKDGLSCYGKWTYYHSRTSELERKFQELRGRAVLRGVVHAEFKEQGSSASQVTAAQGLDVIARLPGCAGQASDSQGGGRSDTAQTS